MDEGVITRGPRGFIISSQTGAKRIDLDILEQPFDILILIMDRKDFALKEIS